MGLWAGLPGPSPCPPPFFSLVGRHRARPGRLVPSCHLCMAGRRACHFYSCGARASWLPTATGTTGAGADHHHRLPLPRRYRRAPCAAHTLHLFHTRTTTCAAAMAPRHTGQARAHYRPPLHIQADTGSWVSIRPSFTAATNAPVPNHATPTSHTPAHTLQATTACCARAWATAGGCGRAGGRHCGHHHQPYATPALAQHPAVGRGYRMPLPYRRDLHALTPRAQGLHSPKRGASPAPPSLCRRYNLLSAFPPPRWFWPDELPPAGAPAFPWRTAHHYPPALHGFARAAPAQET